MLFRDLPNHIAQRIDIVLRQLVDELDAAPIARKPSHSTVEFANVCELYAEDVIDTQLGA